MAGKKSIQLGPQLVLKMTLTRLSGPPLLNTKQEPTRKIDKGLIMLMAEILHQLRLVVYPIIYRVLYIPGGCFGISSINSSRVSWRDSSGQLTS